MNKRIKKSGTLILEQVSFSEILTRHVCKNNSTSGKISVPRDLIGKQVYVIIPEEEG